MNEIPNGKHAKWNILQYSKTRKRWTDWDIRLANGFTVFAFCREGNRDRTTTKNWTNFFEILFWPAFNMAEISIKLWHAMADAISTAASFSFYFISFRSHAPTPQSSLRTAPHISLAWIHSSFESIKPLWNLNAIRLNFVSVVELLKMFRFSSPALHYTFMAFCCFSGCLSICEKLASEIHEKK